MFHFWHTTPHNKFYEPILSFYFFFDYLKGNAPSSLKVRLSLTRLRHTIIKDSTEFTAHNKTEIRVNIASSFRKQWRSVHRNMKQ